MSLESMKDRTDLAAQWYKAFIRRNPGAETSHLVEGYDGELFKRAFGETVDEFHDQIGISGMSEDETSMLFVFEDGSIVISASLNEMASIFALPKEAALKAGLYQITQEVVIQSLVERSPKPIIDNVCANANIIFSQAIKMKIEQLQPENERPC